MFILTIKIHKPRSMVTTLILIEICFIKLFSIRTQISEDHEHMDYVLEIILKNRGRQRVCH